MKKYQTYFRTTLREYFVYKADVFLGMIFNIIFFAVSFAIWASVYREGNISQIAGFSLVDTITYYFITSIIWRFDASEETFLGDMIWNGYLTNDLIRPINARIMSILDAFSGVLVNVLLFIPIGLAIILVAHKYLTLPTSANLLYFIISLLLGMVVNLAFFLIVHALTFHYGDQEASFDLLDFITKFLAGATVPLMFLPGKLRIVLEYLPFKYIFNDPINIYLGKMDVRQIYYSFAGAIIWSVAFYVIFYKVYKSGFKKYTGIGR